MSLRMYLTDLKAATNSESLFVNLKWFLLSHTLHLVFLVRLGQDLYRIPFLGKIFAALVEYVIRILYSSDISCKARIDEGLVILHGHDIVIGASVSIGKRCKVFNGVTLGNKNIDSSSYNNQPTVGDDVVLCTGAKILGPLFIGNNVLVGANSVVLKDCPENTIFAGAPARMIKDHR